MKYYDFIGVFFIGAMGAGKRNIYKYCLSIRFSLSKNLEHF